MSSYIMHLCISDKVKRNIGLTDKFVYGSVLPDIIKNITGDRDKTHYIKNVKVGQEIRHLPDIQKAIDELDIKDKEIKLGYIAHLIEDYIWFNEDIPNYSEIVSDKELRYNKDNTIHSLEEFRQDMYSDYTSSNYYIVKTTDTNIEELKDNLLAVIQDSEHQKVLLENMLYDVNADVDKNIFMTKENIDSYVQRATKEVENKIMELLGE